LALRVPCGEGFMESRRLDPSRVAWLEPMRGAPVSPEEAFREAASRPINAPRLGEERFRSAAIIVPDHTRPPSPLLASLLGALSRVDELAVFVAGGTHSPPSLSQLRRMVGEELLEQHWFRFRHSCARTSTFTHLGYTSRGTPVEVNRDLLNYELIISTLCVRPHYFAGWEGGAKAILPGCSSFKSIARNHSYAVGCPTARELIAEGNPVREDMEEAASILARHVKLRALDFVVDVDGRLCAAFYGHHVAEHREAARLSRRLYVVEAEPVELVIAVAEGGLGRSLFQALKAYHHASNIAWPRRGRARVVLVATMEEGVGSESFEREYSRYVGAPAEEVVRDLKERIEAGEFSEVFQKVARMAMDRERAELVVVAPKAPMSLRRFLERVEVPYYEELDEALEGFNGRAAVLPYGASVVPTTSSSMNTLSRSV